MTLQKITQSFDEIVNILSKGLVNGDPSIEHMRCAYRLQDSDLIYISNAFNFVDLDPKKDSIQKITLYQLID